MLHTIVQRMTNKISVSTAVELSAMLDDYGTVDAEITFNNNFGIKEVPAQIFGIQVSELKVNYIGSLNPIVPASLILAMLEEKHNEN